MKKLYVATFAVVFLCTTTAFPQVLKKVLGSFQSLAFGKSEWVDLDNDNDLDLIMVGSDAFYRATTLVYENEGFSSFVLHTTDLPNLLSGSFVVGDYDKDGDKDILISGTVDSNNNVSAIYRNDGNYTFSLQFSFQGMTEPSLAWFDADRDDDLDVILTGSPNSTWGSGRTIFYENTGANYVEFANTNIPDYFGARFAVADGNGDGLPDIMVAGISETVLFLNQGNKTFARDNSSIFKHLMSGARWGDMDQDGDLDIVLSGPDDSNQSQTLLYQNVDGHWQETAHMAFSAISSRPNSLLLYDYNNDGRLDVLQIADGAGNTNRQYTNVGNNFFGNYIEPEVDPLGEAALDAGDFDNDGDVDVAFQGYMFNFPAKPLAGFFRNQFVNGVSTSNSPPLPPSSATFTERGYRRGIRLSWAAGSDAQTPANALTYNFYLRNSSGRIITPDADLTTGYLRTATMPNGQGRKGYVNAVPEGTLYYAVQAIDGAKVGSVFSAEKSFYHFNGPEALAAELLDEDDVKLTWLDHSAMETNYRIERSLSWDAGFSTLATLAANSKTYTNRFAFQTETPYYYRITAYNASHTAPYDSLQLVIPNRVTDVQAVALTASAVRLSWTDQSQFETGFSIERRQDNETQFTRIGLARVNQQSFEDNTLEPGTTYEYRIRSISANGGLLPANSVTVTTNYLPVVGDFAVTVAEDNTLNFTADDFVGHFSDQNPDDELVEILIVGQPADGVLYLGDEPVISDQKIAREDLDKLNYRPVANFNGITGFQLSVSDGKDYALIPATVQINVTSVNDPPAFSFYDALRTEEDFYTIRLSPLVEYVPYDEDYNVKFSVTASPAGIVNVSVENEQIVIAAIENQYGLVTFELTADDGGSEFNTSSLTFTLDVLPVDDPPRLSHVEDVIVEEAGDLDPITVRLTDVDSPVNGYTLRALAYNQTFIPNQNLTVTELQTGVFQLKVKPNNVAGWAIIYLEAMKGGVLATTSFALTVLQITGTEDRMTEMADAYPNPFSDRISIALDASLRDDYIITLRDVLGRARLAQTFSGTETYVDAGLLEKGIYIMELKGKNGITIVRKMVRE